MTCDFQQCGILTSVDLDEHAQPPFKLRNSKCYSVSSLTVKKKKKKKSQRLRICVGCSEPPPGTLEYSSFL